VNVTTQTGWSPTHVSLPQAVPGPASTAMGPSKVPPSNIIDASPPPPPWQADSKTESEPQTHAEPPEQLAKSNGGDDGQSQTPPLTGQQSGGAPGHPGPPHLEMDSSQPGGGVVPQDQVPALHVAGP
jgi:hypothetical protein